MKRTAYLQSAAILSFLSMLLACSTSNNDVGTVVHDGGGANGGSSATGGNSGSGGAGVVDAKDAPDQSACNQLAAAAQTQLQSYLDSTASLACQVDSDCSLLHLQSVNCFAACGLLVGAGNVSGVTTAASTVCDQYVGAGCPEIRLTCPASPSFCNHGKCAVTAPGSTGGVAGSSGGFGGTFSSGGTGGASQASTGGVGGVSDATTAPDAAVCDQLSAVALTQFQSYLDSQPTRACRSDSDCEVTSFSSLNCFLSCGFAMGKAEVAAASATAATVCDQYFAAGCPAMLPLLCPAGAVPSSACDHGWCGGLVPDAGTGGASSAGGTSGGGGNSGGGGGASGGGGTSGGGGASGSGGSSGRGGTSGAGGTTAIDGGDVLDSAASSSCTGCGADELCVGYYDGTCKELGAHCVKVSTATIDSVMVKHESCFMKPTGDEICGNTDGGVRWGCNYTPCPNQTLVTDVNCYGP